MKKPSKKMLAIVGTTVLALGLMVLPAMADTTGTNWFGQMRNMMNQTFTPDQQQQFMNSSAM